MGKFNEKNNLKKSAHTAYSVEQSRHYNKNRSTKIEYANLRISTSREKDFRIHLLIFGVLFAVLLITYLTGNNEGLLQFPTGNRGFVLSLEKNTYSFSTTGFEYYSKCPPVRNPKLKTSSLWILRPFKNGTIYIKDIYKFVKKPSQVAVMVKYFIAAPINSKISVIGKSPKLNEQVNADLSQYGDGYCTRVLFFGMVDEIKIEAFTSVNGGFILIDDFLVGIGAFDGIEEESCS